MSTALEQVVRPFADKDTAPSPYTKPGQGSVPMVRLAIGRNGSLKTLGFSLSITITTKMGQAHHEKAPTNSAALQTQLSEAAGS